MAGSGERKNEVRREGKRNGGCDGRERKGLAGSGEGKTEVRKKGKERLCVRDERGKTW